MELAEGEVLASVTTEYAEQGCAVLLEISEDGEDMLLMPLELKDEYKKHGTKLIIRYTLSRIRQDVCLTGMPAVLNEVREVK